MLIGVLFGIDYTKIQIRYFLNKLPKDYQFFFFFLMGLEFTEV